MLFDNSRIAEICRAEYLQIARHALQRLAVENVRRDLDDYQGRPIVEPPLLVQLSTAIYPSGEKNLGGSSLSGSSLIDTNAFDLMAACEREFREIVPEWWANDSLIHSCINVLHSLSTRLDAGTVDEISSWARRWVDKIDDYLRPARRTPLDIKCPYCKVKKRELVNEEGSLGRIHCLHAVWVEERVDRVECSGCGLIVPRASIWELIEKARGELRPSE